jgi:TRAP-type C4-dicarboxylate transport system substrate-binding protein
MTASRRSAVLLAVVSLAVAAGCRSGDGSLSNNDAAAKAGRKSAPMTITIADAQQSDDPSSAALDEFASQVASLSNGSIEVHIAYDASRDDPADPASDKPIINQLRAGAFQMAVVPARAWAFADVASLQALQAPFLVQSDEQMDAIVRDKAVVSSLFGGLDAIDVHGLTIFPESLRHFFSFTAPILTPDDVKGRQIRAPSAPDMAKLFSTLGATPVDPAFDDFSAGVENGTITAADSAFGIALSVTPRPGTATGNLTLYSKMVTLVANSRFWNALSDAQQNELTTAAQKAQDLAIAHRVKEREAAANYCASGGSIVLTDAQSLVDFRSAAAPIYAELERNADTKRTIDAIDALATGTSEPAVAACGSPAVPSPPTELVARGGDLPNGVYRVEYTEEYLRSLHLNESLIAENHGVWTYHLQDGHYTWDVPGGSLPPPTHGEGTYEVDGDQLLWAWEDGKILHLTWSVDDDGALHFVQTDVVGDLDWGFQLPWPRIGDL